jgi:type IX secretion system PorP/SprF family membrane protein
MSNYGKQVITGIAMLTLTGVMHAQQLPLYSQYYAIPFLQNPSLAGNTEWVNASLIHKSMWKDIPGAPVTSALTVEGPIQEKNIGLGAIVFSDVTDILQRMGFGTSYSYRFNINDDNRILFGASIGVTDTRIDFTRAIVQDVNDPMILSNSQHKTVFDAAFGITYGWKTLEIGLCAPQLLGNTVSMSNGPSDATYVFTRHFSASAKYTFDINKDKGLRVFPMAVVRYVKNAPLQYDVNAVLDWEKRGWLGVTYRSSYAVGLNLGIRINQSLRAGYAYDLAIGNIASYSGGSHEILLGYTFGKKEEKPVDPTTSPTTNVPSPKDNLTDSLLMVLKKENADNKQQIEQLKQQLEEVKKGGGSNNPGGNDPKGPNPEANKNMNDSTGAMRPSNASDFTDEDGKTIIPNYYVIVGAYKNKEGALERKADYIKRGFPLTTIIYNAKKQLYYTSVISTANEEAANRELQDAKYGTPDAWVFIMK